MTTTIYPTDGKDRRLWFLVTTVWLLLFLSSAALQQASRWAPSMVRVLKYRPIVSLSWGEKEEGRQRRAGRRRKRRRKSVYFPPKQLFNRLKQFSFLTDNVEKENRECSSTFGQNFVRKNNSVLVQRHENKFQGWTFVLSKAALHIVLRRSQVWLDDSTVFLHEWVFDLNDCSFLTQTVHK